MSNLNQATNEFFLDTENDIKNYNLAEEYKNIGHLSGACTHYLRAAERSNDADLVYECLIKLALCFDKQGNRNQTVRGILKTAVLNQPNRAEAYFLLSRHYEWCKEYVDGYMYAELGLNFGKVEMLNDVDYPGKYGLIFEKAVCAWHWGKGDESRELFNKLLLEYSNVMDKIYLESVKNNLFNLGNKNEKSN